MSDVIIILRQGSPRSSCCNVSQVNSDHVLYSSPHMNCLVSGEGKDGARGPMFQFYFTPSSGDFNIQEDEKFDEYVHMIKNFDMLYQGKSTRSKADYSFCQYSLDSACFVSDHCDISS